MDCTATFYCVCVFIINYCSLFIFYFYFNSGSMRIANYLHNNTYKNDDVCQINVNNNK